MKEVLEREIVKESKNIQLIKENQEIIDLITLCQIEGDYIEIRQRYLLNFNRFRYLLYRVNYSMGLFRRAYYVIQQAINNNQLYLKEKQRVEMGEEIQNMNSELDSQQSVEPAGKGGAK